MNTLKLVKVSLFLSAFVLTGFGLINTSRVAAGAAFQGNGAQLYSAKCALCHGRDGRGLPTYRSKGQPDLTDASWQQSHSDAQIAEAVKNGKGKMPGFKGKISDADLGAVIRHVRSLRK